MPSSHGIIAVFVRNPVFANLLAIGILVAGAMALKGLPRETFAETSVDHILVTVPFPGATPEDVEESICIKVEQAIQGIPGIWEITSYSEENKGMIVAAVDPTVSPTAEVLRQIQDRVGAIPTFPTLAEKPVVVEVIVRSAVISVGVHGDAPERTIKQVAEDIRNDLMANPAISQVSISGVREYQVSIQLTEEALKRYGLTLQQVMEAVSQSSLDLPAGTLRTTREEISVRTIGQRYTARDFEDLVIIAHTDGTSVRLGQVASVRDTFEQTPVFGRVNGQPGAMITVSKTRKEDTIGIARLVRDYVKEVQPDLPEGIQLSIWADTSRDVNARLHMLARNGLLGMGLVLICLVVFLDLRSALGAALGIPISFGGALAVMALVGATLNMISLLGMLMAIGLIVDDAIVIAESVRARSREGLPPELAAIEGTRRVALPVLVALLTTVVAFVPLMYVQGVMGKLIFVLPVVVIAAIAASGIEAFVILPAHLCEWSAAPGATQTASWRTTLRRRIDTVIDNFIAGSYRSWLRRSCSLRLVVLSVSFSGILLCAGLVLGGRTPFVLFPKIDGNTVRARLRFPEGMPIEACEAAVARMETAAEALNDDPALAPATPGKLVQQIYSALGEWVDYVPKRSSSLCETSIELMPAELRRRDSTLIIEHWRKAIGDIPDAVLLAITRQELGPTEKPIEIRLLGEDLDELERAADEIGKKLEQFAGVFDVEADLIPGKRELRVSLKPEANNLGITVADLAGQLRQGLFGGEAVRIQRGPDEVKVMVSYTESDRRSLGALENTRIRSIHGDEVPFREIAETRLVRGYSMISRQDGKRRVRVYADVDERYANAEQVVQSMEESFLPELDAAYVGVTYLLDGQRKRIDESMSSLARAFTVAIVVMFVLLGAVLKSYAQPLIIMGAVPLGMIGAILGHSVLGYDLTLMSVFGMVALAGIAVNDSLVLVDRINRNLAEGLAVFDAVIDAAESRFRAVVLTTVTTVAGLLPLLLERSSQAQSLIPMAISVAFGILFATVLTLVIVPALFLAVNDLKRFAYWLWHGGEYPLPERVERAVAAPPSLTST